MRAEGKVQKDFFARSYMKYADQHRKVIFAISTPLGEVGAGLVSKNDFC